MSSVSPPNESDTHRIAVDSDTKQSGGGTEGIVDHLNEAQLVDELCDRLESRDPLAIIDAICHQDIDAVIAELERRMRDGQPGKR